MKLISNDGGPAFPQNDAAVNRINNEAGMSLRDYFAGHALIACMSSPRWLNGLDVVATKTGTPMKEALAEMVYQYADAMLKERDKLAAKGTV